MAPKKDEEKEVTGPGTPPVETPPADTPPDTPPVETPPAETPPATKPPKEEKKKTVEVDADVLSKLVSGYETMQQKVTDLEGAADVGRLDKIRSARMEGKLIKNAKLSVHDGKIVLGWKRQTDEVYFDEQGRLHEDQTVVLFLDQGEGKKAKETEPMSYRAFSRTTTKVEGEVISESRDKDGQKFFKVQLEDGRTFEVSVVFVN